MTDGSHEYQCDGKEIDVEDFFGASVGLDTIPRKMSGFSGLCEGLLRKSWETKDEYDRRMKEK